MSAGRTGTYYLRSFGCQMNDHDSECIAGMLEQLGFVRCVAPTEADVLVYNTCSIREKADRRLAGHLAVAGKLKKDEPARTVVLAGCLPQSRREGLLSDFPFVDVLVGPQSLDRLPELLSNKQKGDGPVGSFDDRTTRWSAQLPRVRKEGPCAWVQITAGCSNFCSYCIVPYVRGPEASRPAREVLVEVEELAREGVKEVTFLGQNVNAYGKERGFGGEESFAGLLRSACGIGGIERLRFMTSHPKDVSPALIQLMALSNPVCEHIHLPVQSGSDSVLRAMRRGYDTKSYLDLVRMIREAVGGVSLTTDIIVGFPGETEADFQDTLALVEECRFDGAFTFIYSPRPHTAAAALPGRIDPGIAQARMVRLVEAVQRIGREVNQAWVGNVVEVLVERVNSHGSADVMGRTRTHKPVHFQSAALPGDLVMVELKGATSTSFKGCAVNESGGDRSVRP
jgi:tRNA-2-methylthio-N6-dimethylallyladenosine synthase